MSKRILLKDKFPDIYNLIHPSKNEQLNISTITCGSNKKIWWKCPISCGHHEWEATVCHMVRPRKTNIKTPGCPYCHGLKTCQCQSVGMLYPKIWEIFDSKDSKNIDIDLYTLPIKSEKSIQCICLKSKCEHTHKWNCKIYELTNGGGCPFCASKRICICNSVHQLCPNLVEEFDQSLNLNIDLKKVSKGSNKYVIWKCNKAKCDHHVWSAKICDRTKLNNPTNCPYCVSQKICKCDSFAENYPKLLEEFDEKKNNDLDPFTISISSGKNIVWKCKDCSKNWIAPIFNRTRANSEFGSGCPNCKLSRMERQTRNFLELSKIDYECQKKFKECKNIRPLPFDFYLPNYNAIIEVDGKQHFESGCFGGSNKTDLKEQQMKDGIKNDYARSKNINLLRVSYSEFDRGNLIDILEEFIKMLSSKTRVEIFIGKEYAKDIIFDIFKSHAQLIYDYL